MSANHVSRLALAAIFRAVLVAVLTITTLAQTPSVTYTVLYKFGTNTNDPLQPHGVGVIAQGRDGNLYTTSASGGTTNAGTVFKATPSGTVTVVSNLGSPGNNPYSGVTMGTDGNFYGTTELNGEGPGTAFKVTPAGVETGLHIFGNAGDGACPYAPPIEGVDGNYYGTTTTVCGFGSQSTVYELTSAGVLTTLYTFTDGSNVTAPVVQGTDGNFYGGSVNGGTSNDGVIFKMTPSGTVTVLHDFAGTDGTGAYAGLIQGVDGNFYGVTYAGGSSNAGVAFRITPAGTYTILHNFNGTSDGNGPYISLMQASDRKLYGVTNGGGSSNLGTMFSVTTTGTFNVLVNFGGVNGEIPNSPLKQHTSGVLYGDTYEGGDLSVCGGNGCGVFYSLNIGAKPFVSLVSTSGRVGSKIGILGQGFSASSVVKFNGVTATTVARTGTTFLLATVPVGASDGFVTVTTGTATLTSSTKFVVHNSWASGANMPTAVAHVAGNGTIGGKIYLVGGMTSSAVITTNQVYNPNANTWSTGAPLPAATAFGASAVVGNILYVFGGTADLSTDVDAVWAYNPSTNSWSSKAVMPSPRRSAEAVVAGGLIYVIGGYHNGRLGTVEVYNPSTNTWSSKTSMLVGKSEVALGVFGTTIVAADGFTSSADTGDNEAYSISGNSWSSLTSDPTPRNEGCSGMLLGRLYIASGGDNGTPVTLNESFSLSGDAWTTQASIPTATLSSGYAVSNGQLYCFGGATVDSNFPPVLSNVQIYQP